MATYNGEKYIKEQLDSILYQLGEEDEIVISDDDSTDKTIEIIESYHDRRIKIFHHKQDEKSKSKEIASVNLVTNNFENALKHASGDYIFLSDQDDVWLPNKVPVMLSYLIKYDYVVSDCYITDEKLKILYSTRFYEGAKIVKNRWKALFYSTPYQGGCAAFNRKVLTYVLPFPKKLQSHDRWIGFVSSFFFKHIIISEKLIHYRKHQHNISSAASNKSENTIGYRIKCRMYYIIELFKLKSNKICLHSQKKNDILPLF
jgi:glycosyltransferase involved in cell wall biosynthesis